MLYKYVLWEIENDGAHKIFDGFVKLKEAPTNQFVEKLILKELEEIVQMTGLCLHNEIQIKEPILDYFDLAEVDDKSEYYIFATTLIQNKCEECIDRFGPHPNLILEIEFLTHNIILEGDSIMPEEFLTHKFTPIREYAKKLVRKS